PVARGCDDMSCPALHLWPRASRGLYDKHGRSTRTVQLDDTSGTAAGRTADERSASCPPTRRTRDPASDRPPRLSGPTTLVVSDEAAMTNPSLAVLTGPPSSERAF